MNNNGVENNHTAEPFITTIDPTQIHTEPVTVPVVVPNTVPEEANVANASFNSVPTPVSPEAVNNTINNIPEQIKVPETTPQVIEVEETEEERLARKEKRRKKRKISVIFILIIIIILLGGALFFVKTTSDRTIDELRYTCSPLEESKGETNLDVNSTLVQSLYSKVVTSVREDLAQPKWNDTMKIYLAYRQIPEYDIFETNCNGFDKLKMEPYTCEKSSTFTPKGFKRSTLELKWKELFGEMTEMPKINIKLDNACVGGFEYIPSRDEYVQGTCKMNTSGAYKVVKNLTEAKYSNNMIVLTEEVNYSGQENMVLPDYLKSGKYYYTFRLDMNYNYVLVSKEYEEKY